jgi:hypothetical protein
MGILTKVLCSYWPLESMGKFLSEQSDLKNDCGECTSHASKLSFMCVTVPTVYLVYGWVPWGIRRHLLLLWLWQSLLLLTGFPDNAPGSTLEWDHSRDPGAQGRALCYRYFPGQAQHMARDPAETLTWRKQGSGRWPKRDCLSFGCPGS